MGISNPTDTSQTEDLLGTIASDTTSLDGKDFATEATMTADLQSIEDNQTDKTQMTQITNGTIEADVVAATDDMTDLDDMNGVVTNAVINVRISNTDIRPLRADSSTHSIQTLDYEHHEIHSGSHYYIQGFIELDDTDTFYVKLVTPNTTTWSHFIFDIKSTGICATTLDEAATGGMTGGAAITPLNNNRNSGNTSGMTITGGVTACTGYTTRLEDDKWGANGFKETIGGGSGRSDELVLKQNTVYCRGFVSGADSNIIQFKASWYEHTDKN